MEKLEKYSNALATLTSFISSSFIAELLNRKDILDDEPGRFLYTILFKSNNGLDTTSFLLANYSGKPHFVDSLVIILRSIISDYAILWYLLVLSDDPDDHKQEKFSRNVQSLNFDHVMSTIAGLRNNFGPIHGFTKSQIEENIAEIIKNRPQYFDGNGDPIVEKIKWSVRIALTEIAKRRKSPEELWLAQRYYHHFDIFSKYEHLGEFSFHLIHRQYDSKLREELARDIVDAITVLVIPMMKVALGLFPDIYQRHSVTFEERLRHLSAAAGPILASN